MDPGTLFDFSRFLTIRVGQGGLGPILPPPAACVPGVTYAFLSPDGMSLATYTEPRGQGAFFAAAVDFGAVPIPRGPIPIVAPRYRQSLAGPMAQRFTETMRARNVAAASIPASDMPMLVLCLKRGGGFRMVLTRTAWADYQHYAGNGPRPRLAPAAAVRDWQVRDWTAVPAPPRPPDVFDCFSHAVNGVLCAQPLAPTVPLDPVIPAPLTFFDERDSLTPQRVVYTGIPQSYDQQGEATGLYTAVQPVVDGLLLGRQIRTVRGQLEADAPSLTYQWFPNHAGGLAPADAATQYVLVGDKGILLDAESMPDAFFAVLPVSGLAFEDLGAALPGVVWHQQNIYGPYRPLTAIDSGPQGVLSVPTADGLAGQGSAYKLVPSEFTLMANVDTRPNAPGVADAQAVLVDDTVAAFNLARAEPILAANGTFAAL